MGFRTAPKLTTQAELEGFARVVVRGGTLSADETLAEVTLAVRDAGLTEPGQVAAELVARARDELTRDQADWPTRTDYDRLQAAFDALTSADIAVTQAVPDHWTAKAELDRRAVAGEPCRGVVWFTAPDVWHAVDHGMLELNVWHPDSANVAPGDALLDEVVSALAAHELSAHFDEGRIEVDAHWHRRV